MDAGGATAYSWNITSSGEEAERILMEANAIAEQKMKDKFPTLPTALPNLEETTGTDFR
jgi:hypothetical protein